jgi:hypothetical protein
MAKKASCVHDWKHSHIEYGRPRRVRSHQYEGDERIIRVRDMWQISKCTKCGATNRESDLEYL